MSIPEAPLHRRTALFLAAGLLTSRGVRAQLQAAPPALLAGPKRSHGISLLGTPALPEDFPYFPWVNPEAPKGGEVALSAIGTFDSFNPFIVRGTAGPVEAVWETLLMTNPDEPAAAYGHLAHTIEIAPDHSWVAFELRPEAHFHDGHPVTATDVVWTFDTLRKQGRPYFRVYYAGVANAVAETPRRVVFHLKDPTNRELPQILGEFAILPRHFWQGREFGEPLKDPPLGSGPYRLERFEFGRNLVLQRVPDWWAASLPTGKGLHNFGTIRTEFFRDSTVALQAFKAGQVDFRQENIAKDWATAYNFPARESGLVKLEEIPSHHAVGMQGFVMNLRRPVFADRHVRQAMAWAFDFEWANKNLFYGDYTRTKSYFSNTEFASSGIPAGEELALLSQYRDKLPPELFTTEFTLPVTDGSGNNRAELRTALDLCQKAGWSVKDRRMVDAQGKPVSFEILLDSPSYERVALPYVQSLAKIGIEARVRTVDAAQFQHLTDVFDYDMTMFAFPGTESPGNEQRDYWGSEAAKTQASANLTGTADPVVDALLAQLVNAPDIDRLRTVTRALDRVLLWNWGIVPHWYLQSVRAAYWNRFARPAKPVRSGLVFDSWWIDPNLAIKTDAARQHG